ncbi:hypothetical protein DFH07DRAFT_968792 [Mycena maculata]|uniref:Uncharacterized protein n=1 Tax=Mycena maculata TaxID=230809 RepID=A0AAD7MSJ1_9AGAR|nr:hypothetical protein DFH07DRAFT_968792 [Mycena maculata]
MGDSLFDDSWTRMHATGAGEPFHAYPHWHLAQDEAHVIIKGKVQLIQNGVVRIVSLKDGTVITRQGVVHSIKSFPGEEAIVEETTMPIGTMEQKVLFFRNMLAPGMHQSFVGLMQVFYYRDAYPALPTRIRWLEWLLVVVVGEWVAQLLGYRIPDKHLRFKTVPSA